MELDVGRWWMIQLLGCRQMYLFQVRTFTSYFITLCNYFNYKYLQHSLYCHTLVTLCSLLLLKLFSLNWPVKMCIFHIFVAIASLINGNPVYATCQKPAGPPQYS